MGVMNWGWFRIFGRLECYAGGEERYFILMHRRVLERNGLLLGSWELICSLRRHISWVVLRGLGCCMFERVLDLSRWYMVGDRRKVFARELKMFLELWDLLRRWN